MAATKPYLRTCRQFTDGSYDAAGKGRYVADSRFAKEGEHYVRAFTLIQKDLHELFDYVEPADVNKDCYSYRIHALHMRTCIEIEANCKAILTENGYSAAGNWDMRDYKKLEPTHHLSAYEIMLPVWRGTQTVRTPFRSWSTDGTLAWYQAYNAAKHDRHLQFPQANFGNLLEAVCGLVAILSSQFHTWDFSPQPPFLALSFGGPPQGFENGIGGYFQVKFPDNWTPEDQYNFDWDRLKDDPDPFQKVTFKS
jgi:hypothetical protein